MPSGTVVAKNRCRERKAEGRRGEFLRDRALQQRPADTAVRVREVRLGPRELLLVRGAGGTSYLCSPHTLAPYPAKLTERLEYWAKTAPSRIFLAQRNAAGLWRELSYANALAQVRRSSEALLRRNLSADRPIVILSGNDIEHALLGARRDLRRCSLRAGFPRLFVGLNRFRASCADHQSADAGARVRRGRRAYRRAQLMRRVAPDTELVVSRNLPANRPATKFAELAR